MLTKKTVIGAFILLAFLAGPLWYLHMAHAHKSNCPRGHVVPTCQTDTGYSADWHGNRTFRRSGGGQTLTRCSSAHCSQTPCCLNRRGWHTD